MVAASAGTVGGLPQQLSDGAMTLTDTTTGLPVPLMGGYPRSVPYGADAGETVPHLHVHLLSGRKLAWPPG